MMYKTGNEVSKRSIGVNFNPHGVASIILWAPLVEQVSIYINNKDKTLELEKADQGYWTLDTTAISPGDTYQFILDGDKFRPDPASLLQLNGVHGPSTAFNLNDYAWRDKHWNNIPLKNYIIYELHTGTFTREGNFRSLETKLDYLEQLGINAIEIMPVAQFSGTRNWGYDGVYPFAVQDSYGGPEHLQHLIDTCHKKGFAVILDVVYNHMGPEGNYMPDFGPYFTSKYKVPWGNAINFDDEWCDGVRTYFKENALMWFRDFHIDALRLDAVHALKDFSACHILEEIRIATHQLMQSTERTHYLIAECDLNDTRFINSLDKGGYGMDAQWTDEFHHALRVTAGGSTEGYYEDFKGIAQLAKAYKDAYVYDGTYSIHRKKTFGSKTTYNTGQQFIAFSQNHDQIGNRMLGERSNALMSIEMCKLMAGAVMAAPFIPMLFMGEEYGETNPFLYFVSHEDPALQEMVREGRKNEFAAFHTKGEAPDPSLETTFEQSKLQWNIIEKEPHSTILNYYKNLILLRHKHQVLNNMNKSQLDVACNEMDQTLILHRWQKSHHIIILMNFSKQKQLVTLPSWTNRWHRLFDSAAPEWKGPEKSPDIVYANTQLSLQPESILIYE